MYKIIGIVSAALVIFLLGSCTSGNKHDASAISTDTAVIAKGEQSFTANCSGCHNFRQDAIGPQLGGITKTVSAGWLQQFITDPKKTIAAGDQHAQALFKKFGTLMPSFAIGADETNAIIAFLNTHGETGPKLVLRAGALADPIPKKIALSTLVVEIEAFTKIPPSSDSGKLPLTRITNIGLQPGNTALFVVDLRGKLYRLHENRPEVYMDMAALRPKFIHQPGLATGFGSFAFHPEFSKNGLLYTTHTEASGSAKAEFGFDPIKPLLQWVVTEWKTDHPDAPVFSGKGRELFRVDMVSGIHGVQEIAFNPLAKKGDADYALLYICIGEGGAVENGYPDLAHNITKPWGTVLRIDPAGNNSANGHYGIPPGNPFVKGYPAKTLKEIYAYGFRNPHRITWTKSGKILVCNVGHSSIESINLIVPGGDYGWPVREGNFLHDQYGDLSKVYALPANDNASAFTYPVAEYDHDEGKAISGGLEYWGTAIPALKGKFLFGDIPTGRLFYVETGDLINGKQADIKEWKLKYKGKLQTLTELCGTGRVDLHFGRDSKGELYILTKPDGKVYKIAGATGG